MYFNYTLIVIYLERSVINYEKNYKKNNYERYE